MPDDTPPPTSPRPASSKLAFVMDAATEQPQEAIPPTPRLASPPAPDEPVTLETTAAYRDHDDAAPHDVDAATIREDEPSPAADPAVLLPASSSSSDSTRTESVDLSMPVQPALPAQDSPARGQTRPATPTYIQDSTDPSLPNTTHPASPEEPSSPTSPSPADPHGMYIPAKSPTGTHVHHAKRLRTRTRSRRTIDESALSPTGLITPAAAAEMGIRSGASSATPTNPLALATVAIAALNATVTPAMASPVLMSSPSWKSPVLPPTAIAPSSSSIDDRMTVFTSNDDFAGPRASSDQLAGLIRNDSLAQCDPLPTTPATPAPSAVPLVASTPAPPSPTTPPPALVSPVDPMQAKHIATLTELRSKGNKAFHAGDYKAALAVYAKALTYFERTYGKGVRLHDTKRPSRASLRRKSPSSLSPLAFWRRRESSSVWSGTSTPSEVDARRVNRLAAAAVESGEPGLPPSASTWSVSSNSVRRWLESLFGGGPSSGVSSRGSMSGPTSRPLSRNTSLSSASLLSSTNMPAPDFPFAPDDDAALAPTTSWPTATVPSAWLDAAPPAVLRELAHVFSNRSAAALRIGEYLAALDDADRAVQLHPHWAKAQFRRADALLAMERYGAARAALDRMAHLDPTTRAATARPGGITDAHRGTRIVQLVSGRDVCRPGGTPRWAVVRTVLHAYARQMQNCMYMVVDSATSSAFVVDPAWDTDAILAHVKRRGWTLAGVIVGHAHVDHVGGRPPPPFDKYRVRVPGLWTLVRAVARDSAYPAVRPLPIYMHPDEHEVMASADRGFMTDKALDPHRVVVPTEEGHVVHLGTRTEIRFVHTPGHTPGSQCVLVHGDRLLSSDTVFAGAIGRCDLPGGDPDLMRNSLIRLRATLPDHVAIWPGHAYGATTSTVGREKRRGGALDPRMWDLALAPVGPNEQ
ncbi:hypothetical protein AMAG_13300 [Allomyces macrogynus ATCC 38327]|uniref:Metallo-beta-lactamase domain-containing protein n=1 Tax=Allomyces macrogynus (strain ATCC 38327) TaxID=578462 RepID=A0A0L0T0F7_ALLM3|nr:hypothetical protein AMAG_13300 [Allomyces macrogynus ATCC 38327]|eukprot:KNE68130.1 hypothetical protein AMAG_13300 [Allomyces macrogynus ATCC 38327]